IDFGASPQPAFNGSVHLLIQSLNRLAGEGYTVHLSSDTREEQQRLEELIGEAAAPSSGMAGVEGDTGDAVEELRARPVFLGQALHSGFVYPPARIAVFTEHEIFGRLKRRTMAKIRRYKGLSQKDLHQLKPGDFVVHVDHGVGVFDGLKKIVVGG